MARFFFQGFRRETPHPMAMHGRRRRALGRFLSLEQNTDTQRS